MSDAKDILEAGEKLAGPTILKNGAAFLLARGHQGEERVESLEKFLDHPIRAKQTVSVEDADSFVSYFTRFKISSSVVFAKQGRATDRQFSVVGVLDYHGDAPGHTEHRVTYTPPFSEEWARWRGKDGQRMAQTDFALFVEENSLDIVDSKAAVMVEVSQSLRAKKSVEFVSDQRLSDGSVQFTYNEDVKGTAGRGNVKVPEKFCIGVPIFFNGPAYKITAHLRYRIDGGKLAVWYDLHRAEYVEQDAFNEIVEKVQKGTGAPMFRGSI